MPDAPIHERKFTDQEVREILKKAVQKAPSKALVKSEGLSLTELKSIGEEVGIDPVRLEDAARAVVQGGGNKSGKFLGGPTGMTYERKVSGELDPDDTPEIISLIRRTMGVQGKAEEIHGSLEWSAKSDSGNRYVTISSRNETTTITSSANLETGALLTYLPTGSVGLIATIGGLLAFAREGSLVGLVICLTVLPILLTISRAIWKKFSTAESAKLQEVVDQLARLTIDTGD